MHGNIMHGNIMQGNIMQGNYIKWYELGLGSLWPERQSNIMRGNIMQGNIMQGNIMRQHNNIMQDNYSKWYGLGMKVKCSVFLRSVLRSWVTGSVFLGHRQHVLKSHAACYLGVFLGLRSQAACY
jgi:hypothetical protein